MHNCVRFYAAQIVNARRCLGGRRAEREKKLYADERMAEAEVHASNHLCVTMHLHVDCVSVSERRILSSPLCLFIHIKVCVQPDFSRFFYYKVSTEFMMTEGQTTFLRTQPLINSLRRPI